MHKQDPMDEPESIDVPDVPPDVGGRHAQVVVGEDDQVLDGDTDSDGIDEWLSEWTAELGEEE